METFSDGVRDFFILHPHWSYRCLMENSPELDCPLPVKFVNALLQSSIIAILRQCSNTPNLIRKPGLLGSIITNCRYRNWSRQPISYK